MFRPLYTRLIFSFFLVTLFIFSPSVYADDSASVLPGYRLLESLPFVGIEGEEAPSFPVYIVGIFRLLIYIVGIAAFVMISIGGFWYVTSAGNQTRVSTAKSIIGDAFLGLFVAIFAWLLLYTINPNLTRYGFSAFPGAENLGLIYCYTDEDLMSTNEEYCYSTMEACIEGKDSRTAVGETDCANKVTESSDFPDPNASAPSYNASDCIDCTPATGVNIKPAQGDSSNTLAGKACQGETCMINKDFLPPLQTFMQNIPGSEITEAWPPTVSHKQPCHSIGTCVDMTLNAGINPYHQDYVLAAFERAQEAGLYIELEFPPGHPLLAILQENLPQYKDQIISVSGVSPHFSVYKDKGTKQ